MGLRSSATASGGEYAEAASELEWLIAWASGELGMHAQDYRSDGASFVAVDPGAAHDAHMTEHRRAAIAKVRRIEPVFEALTETHRSWLRLAFTPRQWHRGLRAAFRLHGSNACIAGLAAATSSAVAARAHAEAMSLAKWRRKPDGKPAPRGHESPIEYLRYAVGDDGNGHRDTMRPVIAETRAMLERALAAYEEAYVARYGARRHRGAA